MFHALFGVKTLSGTLLGPAFLESGSGTRDRYKETDCNTEDCPVDCVMSQWTGWQQCSTTCGNGQQHRTREATVGANPRNPATMF